MPRVPKSKYANLLPGLYDRLVAEADQQQLEMFGDPRLYSLLKVDDEEIHTSVAQYVEHLLVSSLAMFRGKDASDRQRRLVDRIVTLLIEELGADCESDFRLVDPLQRLQSVHVHPSNNKCERPDTPLNYSALLTGTRLDPSLASQLRKEISTADRVDVLCSFIRWSGLRLILDELRDLTSKPSDTGLPKLRLITTSYMGATDPKAVEVLGKLPNTEVRVSYDTKRTRLHAKAYVIHRNTGFGSAYVGSANLSQAALSEGLEWTSKISQYELPHLWSKICSTFDTYWNDEEFEPFTGEAIAKLRQSIKREKTQDFQNGDQPIARFDLHPYPYQDEILDVFAAEREVRGKFKHLLVAATGTGKTVVSAFDYRRLCASQNTNGDRPSLLYVAHRKEILSQALGTFRGILRDQNFGDILVGGKDPSQDSHLFCSIQSYNSRELYKLAADHFDYVVVDEFHHAEAPSYQKLMNHIHPKILLGMTATPERADGMDVFRWFDGEASAEIRLPDAINRRLLCPFQYFGISDNVDLDSLTWKRGGYDVQQLDELFTGNDARAGLVLDKTKDTLLDPLQSRGLGFCVSVAHANFMARFFDKHGLPAMALSAESSDEERRSVQQRLVRREINFLFVVDLYNEGVDIPEVDAVLLLRPTESLTVFLQQLGRGLRMHEDKDCLAVLDFVGAQHRNFRFGSRLRALSSEPAVRLDKEVKQGFPHLPAGCAIRLERVAEQRVLENIRQSLQLRRPQIVIELRNLGRHLGCVPTLREAINVLHIDLDALLKRGSWSRLLADAGLSEKPNDPDENQLAKGMCRIAHIDDPHQINFLLKYLKGEWASELGLIEKRRLAMCFVTLFGSQGINWSIEEAQERLLQNQAACKDLVAVLEYCLSTTRTRFEPLEESLSGPLALHASYTRDEILVGLGHWTMDNRPDFREGVLHMPGPKIDAFFVTLQKVESAYSPTTMYEDYAISEKLFHWQSQSTTSVDSPTGQRYIGHREKNYTPILFVREHKRMPGGLSSPYCYLGPADYVSHEGSRPISIVWRLRHAMPARLLRKTARQAIA